METRRSRRLETVLAVLFGAAALSSVSAQGARLGSPEPGDAPATRRAEAAFAFSMAKVHAADGEYERARLLFSEAVALDPEAADLRLEYAELLFGLRELPHALAQIRTARQLAPNDPDVLRAFGELHLLAARQTGGDRESFEAGIQALEKLRERDPGDVQGMVALGQAYRAAGRAEAAVEIYEELVRRNVENRQLKRLLVDTLRQSGRTERARELLGEIIALEREAVDSRLALAELESRRGNHGAAIELLEGAGAGSEDASEELDGLLGQELLARAASPGLASDQREEDLLRAQTLSDGLEDPLRTRLQVSILQLRGDREGALALLRSRAAEAERPWAHLMLGAMLTDAGDEAAALEVWREALERFEGETEARAELLRRLVWGHSRVGDWRAVADAAEALRAVSPEEARDEVLGWQLDALRRAGATDEALAVVRRERSELGPSARLSLQEASLLEAAGRSREARRVLRRREIEDLDEGPLLAERCRLVLELQGAPAAAELGDSLLGATENDEERFETAFAFGRCFSAPDTFDRAVPFLRAAVDGAASLDPAAVADTQFWLGQALERSGRFEAAADAFLAVLAIREDDSTAMNYLGYMWGDRGENLERALELVERAVELEPENGSYVDSLGWVLYRLGRYGDAREALERASRLSPDNAVILEHLGDAYRALGQVEDARTAYERAARLEDQENLEQVRYKLRELAGDAAPN